MLGISDDKDDVYLIAPAPRYLDYESSSLHIDATHMYIFYTLTITISYIFSTTGGVVLSFSVSMTHLTLAAIAVPLTCVANPLFPHNDSLSISVSTQSITSITSPEHWLQFKQCFVLRLARFNEEVSCQWFPPETFCSADANAQYLIHDTHSLCVESFALTTVCLQL